MTRWLLLLVLFCGTAHAQKTCEELRAELAGAPPLTTVRRLANAGCLGDTRDTNPFTLRVQRMLDTTTKVKDVRLSPDERRLLAVGILRAADEYLATLPGGPEVNQMRAAVQQAMRERSAGADSRLQRPAYWQWDGVQPTIGDTGVNPTEGVVRAARLAERAFAADQADAIQAADARAAMRDARWRSYFADARSQYPWELYLNSKRYEATVRGRSGVSGPPDWQWIVLHPDVGMQYVRSAAAGDRFKPALVLELVGYNRWSWGADHRPENAWGASLVRSYADTASVPSGAWGIAVHRNNKYSLTFSRIDGRLGLLFSIDLAGKVTEASEEWKERLRIGR
jgi:hypothetical protein